MDALNCTFYEARLKYLEKKQKFLEAAQLSCEKKLDNNRLMLEKRKSEIALFRVKNEKPVLEKLNVADSIKANNEPAVGPSSNTKCIIS